MFRNKASEGSSKGANSLKRTELRCLRMIEKPRAGEYPAYAHIYIDLLPDDGLIRNHLADNLETTKKFVVSIPKDSLLHIYF